MTGANHWWSSRGGRFGVLVHGGAGARAAEVAADHALGCRAAAEAALSILREGGAALDAVERAVCVLEDDPRFNAGLGAALTEDGAVELDASIMDGDGLRAGAVGALVGFRNAVSAARAVLDEGRHVFLVGEGAVRAAERRGIARVDPASLVTDAARAHLADALARRTAPSSGGTVGAVARDGRGNVAAATSTGGITGKRSGRIGDSPVVGAGTYADNGFGAASATGEGEGILRVVLTARVVALLGAEGDPGEAALAALLRMRDRVGAYGGVVVVDPRGRFGVARTTETMPWSLACEGRATESGF
jgi:beta-aspartyl-peptidase (threonine type)